MILTGHEDPRVQKTIESIQKSFHDLILEKDYRKITVKELCERARINKKTFYTYYETLDDLLLETQSSISEAYRERIRGCSLKDMDKLIREFFLFSEEQGPFYEKITCGGSYEEIRGEMIADVRGAGQCYPELRKLPQAEQDLVETFLADSLLGMYKQWILSGKQLPVERVIQITTELITDGIRRYMK